MPSTPHDATAAADVTADRRPAATVLEAGALQTAIFNGANFSSIAKDAKGVIQIFNVGAERMLTGAPFKDYFTDPHSRTSSKP